MKIRKFIESIKYLFVILILFVNSSCSENTSDPEIQNDFCGEYKIIAISSSEKVDLNNDGVKSNNYFAEF